MCLAYVVFACCRERPELNEATEEPEIKVDLGTRTVHSFYYNFIDLCAVLAARYPSYVDLSVTCKPRAVVLISLLIGNGMEWNEKNAYALHESICKAIVITTFQ